MKTFISLALALAISAVARAESDSEDFEVTGLDKTAEHVCKDGEAVTVSGIGNTVTLTGPCRSIEVSGQRNVVTTEVVESVSVTGQKNKVTWKTALDPKKKVKKSVTGLGNKAAAAK